MYEQFCAAVLATAKSKIGMKAVRMTGECWKTREIANAEKERDHLRKTTGIQTAGYKSKDKELKALLKERKATI